MKKPAFLFVCLFGLLSPGHCHEKQSLGHYCLTIKAIKEGNDKQVIVKDNLEETRKSQSVTEKDTSWYGHYEYYLQASDYPPVFVDYELEISPDSCIFTGNGQMTCFRVLCTVSKKTEECLTLRYLASLGENNSLALVDTEKATLVELYRHNGKYYLKSPHIINKKGKSNVKVKCEKKL